MDVDGRKAAGSGSSATMDVDGSTSSVTPINRDTQEQDHTPPAQQKEHAPPALIDPITSLPFNPVSSISSATIKFMISFIITT